MDRGAGGSVAPNIEYLFLTSAPLFEIGGQITAYGASVRLGAIAPVRALARLGYDARVVSLAGELDPVEAAVRAAKRIVFGEMWFKGDAGWAGTTAPYRHLLGLIGDRAARVVFSIADDHFSDPNFSGFYEETLADCLAVTTVSQNLSKKIQGLTSRPVFVAPEPTEGSRGAPQAIAVRKVPAPLAWLARRAGLSMEQWRVHLLWFGYPQNLAPLVEVIPSLESYSRRHPLLLTLITNPTPDVANLLNSKYTREESRLRVQFVRWSPAVMDPMIAAADVVLIPSDYRNPVKQAKSPNRLVAGLHGGRFVVAHPLPTYAPYGEFAWLGADLGEGIDWAIRHPREVVERIARGQAYIDERHSPDAVARFWLDVFHPRN